MRQKDLKQKDNFRCNAILYSLGRVVLLIMVALTVADVVYLHCLRWQNGNRDDGFSYYTVAWR